MLKKVIMVLSVAAMLFFTLPMALGEETTVDISDFTVLNIGTIQDKILLCGWTGSAFEPEPTLVIMDANGETIWAYSDRSEQGTYRYATEVNNNEILALRTILNNNKSAFEYFSAARVERENIPIDDPSMIYLLSDGYIAGYTKNDQKSLVSYINTKGESQWSYVIDGLFDFKGIDSLQDRYVIYGNLYQYHEDGTESQCGFVLALDSQGNALWQHESPSSESLNAGTLTGNQGIVLTGDIQGTDSNTDLSSYYGSSFVDRYDDEGTTWRFEIQYVNAGCVTQGSTKSIVRIEDTFLVASTVKGNNSEYFIRLFWLDQDGKLLRQWDQDYNDISYPITAQLLLIEDDVLLVTTGYDRQSLATIDKTQYVEITQLNI